MTLVLVAGAAGAVVLAGRRLRPRVRSRPVGPRPDGPAGGRLVLRRVPRWWRVPVGVPAATCALAVHPTLVAAILVAVVAAPQLVALMAERRRRRAVARAVPDGIELLVLSVHAGLTPRQAVAGLAGVGPPALRPAFAEVERRIARGRPLADAVHALTELIGPEWGPVSDQIAAAERDGAVLGPVLARLGDEARRHRQLQAAAEARRLPVRLAVPLVVCTLPAFVLVAIVPIVLAALSSLSGPAW